MFEKVIEVAFAFGAAAVVNGLVFGKYSPYWFKTSSDETLRNEREKERIKAVYGGDSASYALLDLFDKEISERMYAKYKNENHDEHIRHREHGWYLPVSLVWRRSACSPTHWKFPAIICSIGRKIKGHLDGKNEKRGESKRSSPDEDKRISGR